jgi:hypothetical protein
MDDQPTPTSPEIHYCTVCGEIAPYGFAQSGTVNAPAE